MRRTRHLRLSACGLAVDLDAHRITGVADGAAVDTWPAGPGTSLNATAAGASQPVLRASQINGRPSVQFDGSDDVMTLSAGALPLTNNVTALYAIIVGYTSNTGDTTQMGTHISHGGSATSSRGSIQIRNASNTGRSVSRRLDGDAGTNSAAASGTATACIMQQVIDFTGGTHRFGVNGVDAASTALTSAGNTSATDSLAANIGATNSTTNRLTGFMSNVAFGVLLPGAVVRKRIRTKMSRTYRIPTI